MAFIKCASSGMMRALAGRASTSKPNFGIPLARAMQTQSHSGGESLPVRKQQRQRKGQQQQEQGMAPQGGRSLSRTVPSLFSSPAFMPSSMARMMQEMERVFDAFDTDLAPTFGLSPEATEAVKLGSLAVDVKEEDGAFVFSTDVPGMAKDQLNVTISPDRVLTISGERSHFAEEGAGGEGEEGKEGVEEGGEQKERAGPRMHRVERAFGAFQRSFRLPANVDTSRVRATVDSGVLTVTVPKAEKEEPQGTRVEIE